MKNIILFLMILAAVACAPLPNKSNEQRLHERAKTEKKARNAFLVWGFAVYTAIKFISKKTF